MEIHDEAAMPAAVNRVNTEVALPIMSQKRKRLSASARRDLSKQVQQLYCQGLSVSGIQAKIGIRKDLLERILFNLFRDKSIEPQESTIEVVSASSMVKTIAGDLASEYYEVTRDDSGMLILSPFNSVN